MLTVENTISTITLEITASTKYDKQYFENIAKERKLELVLSEELEVNFEKIYRYLLTVNHSNLKDFLRKLSYLLNCTKHLNSRFSAHKEVGND